MKVGLRDKSDGLVAVIFSSPNKEKYSVLSDTVTVLSALSNVDRFEKIEKGLKQRALCLAGQRSEKLIDCYYQDKAVLENQEIEFEEKKQFCRKCGIAGFLSELAHQCKKESGIESYWDDVTLEEIDKCIVVHPELNNARIIQQQGLFILCGLNAEDPCEPSAKLDSFFVENDDGDSKRTYIRFPNDCLKQCQEELKRLGINRSQVYFDLEKTIEFEREKII